MMMQVKCVGIFVVTVTTYCTLGENFMQGVADILIINIRQYKGELNSPLWTEENTRLHVCRSEGRSWL